mgnify:CR=1 FL=1
MLVVSILMTVMIGRTVLKSNKSQITKSIVTLTENKADEVEKQMTQQVYAAESLAGLLGETWTIPEKQRASSAQQALRAMVKSSTIDSAHKLHRT